MVVMLVMLLLLLLLLQFLQSNPHGTNKLPSLLRRSPPTSGASQQLFQIATLRGARVIDTVLWVLHGAIMKGRGCLKSRDALYRCFVRRVRVVLSRSLSRG